MPVTSQVSSLSVPIGSDVALGVLVCERLRRPPFAEAGYIKRLCRIGRSQGIRLFAFAPWTWRPEDDTVRGWSWDDRNECWSSGPRKLPAVVYDRSWPESEAERNRFRLALRAIRNARRLLLLNGSLPHKGGVYEALMQDREIAVLLPPTALYRGADSLAAWLRKHCGSAFLKPIAGSQGKRVIAVSSSQDGSVLLNGRDSRNRPIRRRFDNEEGALRRLDGWIGSRAYLMQPLLDLRTPSGSPCDIRALLQKNRSGRWTITGIAARLGAPASVTANLHGGGTAASASDTLIRHFGASRGNELLREVRRCSIVIVDKLEQTFGRFAEIGLDYGIERNGKLWFLEANTKPGRAAMDSAGQEASILAAEQPLVYAKSILLRPPGRVIHEFDHL